MDDLAGRPAGPGPVDAASDVDGAGLERRWRRERAARLESERIAEAGLRRLWEAKSALDDQVEQRTAQLREEHARAEAAAAAKTVFLASLSHEVRTPLQTILATLELARASDAAEEHRLEAASCAARELCELFDNLLELAQTEVGSVELAPARVRLESLADDLADRWAGRLRQRGLLLVPESAGTAVVDPVRLSQVADALLDNARKFAAPGTIRLRLAGEGGRVELEVADEGPGVAAADLERIFGPFVQLRADDGRVVGGSGIGLALVAGLVAQMGGTVSARRSPPGGLSVTVRLPDGVDPGDAEVGA